ncbi:glutamyl-tRNA reductase [Halobacteriales archaeon SW_7_68_16]|nr:MAG: glutamyl-tRNA reductase [Halobacteriales archaeon SW_7_68_16]
MHAPAGVIRGVRVTRGVATVDEIAAATPADEPSVVESLLDEPGVSEAFAIQTCNRTETYAVADDEATARTAIEAVVPVPGVAVETGTEDGLRHLLRVGAGLESIVLGEDQVLGQLRDAYATAESLGGIGPMLGPGVTKAIHVGERARTETGINEGVLSMGSAAADLLAEERDLTGGTALIVGAGEMATLAARSLAARGVDRVIVANRSPEPAEALAETLSVPGEAVPLSAIGTVIDRADVLVTATGADEPILTPAHLDGRDIAIADLAQPRDVASPAAAVADGPLYDLDDMEALTVETRVARSEAADEVEAMVADEFDRLLEQYKRHRADDVIAAMHEGADRIKHRQVATSIARLEDAGDLTDDQREIVEDLADALVSRLLAAPTRSLRAAAADDDWSTIHTAMDLFDPTGVGPDDAVPDGEMPDADAIPDEVVDRLPEAVRQAVADDD